MALCKLQPTDTHPTAGSTSSFISSSLSRAVPPTPVSAKKRDKVESIGARASHIDFSHSARPFVQYADRCSWR